MNKETQLWYLKAKGRIKGPFASGLISKNILLGRIHPDDLLSQDKEIWRKASSIREVMPDVIKHRHEANYKERLKAARRWDDELDVIRETDVDGKQKVYIPRKKNTHLQTVMVVRIGSGDYSGRKAHGIHWHISENHSQLHANNLQCGIVTKGNISRCLRKI